MSRSLLVVEGGSALFGLDSPLVREIVSPRSLTRLPGAPPHVRGLLTVRGTLVSVIDLAHLLAVGTVSAPEPSVVILVTEGRSLGVLVDDVHEVQEFPEDELLPPPAGDAGHLVRSLGHFGGRVVLDVDVRELVRLTLA
ncbi:MAG: chemotaxis protein CheW [Gemmatimonadaceae bacterium]